METYVMDNSVLENDRDDFQDHFNSTALHSDTSNGFVEPKGRLGDELKFSPILSSNRCEKRSVFGKRIALYKDRGQSPLAKPNKTVTSDCSTSSAAIDSSSLSLNPSDDLSLAHKEKEFKNPSCLQESSTLLSSPSTYMSASRITNPFDSHLADSLHMSTLSPGLFEPMKSPENKDSIWSIEDRSILNPAIFTEEEIMNRRASPDPHVEAKLQAQLTLFWNSNAGYVPSPDNVKPVVESPASASLPSKRATPFTSSPKTRAPRRKTKALRNTTSQTSWTFPPSVNIDFDRIFGTQFKYTGSDIPEEEFNVSLNSSIARRLFDNSMVSCINESDVNVEDDFDAADQSSVRHDLNGDQSPPPVLKELNLSPIRS